ncbi:MAG: prolipoprotein diacylglyceryl transferase [Pirellulaceae bacterium]|nr:MAG: prolipoprotein diacylglyceryl transferase [Pirellulaceae bacterium]
MRSTLFVIPHEIGGYPLFGVGILLGLLIVSFMAWAAYVMVKMPKPQTILWHALPTWLIAGAIVAFVLPAVELRDAQGIPLGVPIRGYGVMVLTGLLAGIGITIVRGRRLGIPPDTVVALGFWMMLSGVIGARLFYVIQKWEEFEAGGWPQRLVAILKLTEGGLVIYGGVLGGLLACILYCRRHRLNLLATGDLVAPGFLVGLGFGRLGCLLHGCCFGGVCTAPLPAIEFPPQSAPYQTQLVQGKLLGIELDRLELPARVVAVAAGSVAERYGIKVGDTVHAIYVSPLSPVAAADTGGRSRGWMVEVALADRRIGIDATELPAASLPVHPSQVYASINAFLLAWLIWNLQPIPRRDGVVFAVAILLYSVSRFLLEAIRSDELGQFGTSLTIAQWISIGALLMALGGLVLLRKRPVGRVWAWH